RRCEPAAAPTAPPAPPPGGDQPRKQRPAARPPPAVTATDDGLKITLMVAVPEVAETAANPTPAQPTPAELEAFQKQLDDWDAFLVFAVKQLGAVVGDREFRGELLEILLRSRDRL